MQKTITLSLIVLLSFACAIRGQTYDTEARTLTVAQKVCFKEDPANGTDIYCFQALDDLASSLGVLRVGDYVEIPRRLTSPADAGGAIVLQGNTTDGIGYNIDSYQGHMRTYMNSGVTKELQLSNLGAGNFDLSLGGDLVANAGNTFRIGRYNGVSADDSFATAQIRDINTGRIRIGTYGALSYTDYHRWEAGAGANISVIENNSGDEILVFNSTDNFSPAGTDVDAAMFDADVLPLVDNVFSLGCSACAGGSPLRWLNGHFSGDLVVAGTISAGAMSGLSLSSDLTVDVGNAYDLGGFVALGPDNTFAQGWIRDIYSTRIRIGAFNVTGYVDYHRWEQGATANVSVIENNSGDPLLTFDSTNTYSPAASDVDGILVDADFVPHVDGTFSLGTSTLEWQDGFFDGTLTADALQVDVSSTHTGTATFNSTATFNGSFLAGTNLVPTTDNAYQLGTGAVRWSAVNAVNYYGVSGSPGTVATLTCAAGQAVKNITVSSGIVTAVSCGAP